jgi:glucosamine 6-phosphate synthetase-like amidotransferase/phosphosugar isomerase protein
MHSLLRTVGEIGLLRVAVALEGFEDQPPAEHVVRVPRVPEWLSPFVALIPIQWLSYWVAVERGTNPDNERKENPAHARSREFFRL